MGITLGGQACLDPRAAAETCRRLGLPLDWLGRANAFRCPLGAEPGKGAVLLTRAAYDLLPADTRVDLAFHLHPQEVVGRVPSGWSGLVTLKSLVVLGARSLTPGLRDDPAETLLVELADVRHLLARVPCDVAYNVPQTPDGTTYYSGTLNTGTPYTWTQIAAALWALLGASLLGAYPGLPFTPEGTPTDFRFYGGRALAALDAVLDRIGCALAYNPFTATCSIVQAGAADATADSWLAAWDAWRVRDSYEDRTTLGRYPAQVRVLFRKNPPPAGESPWYASTQSPPAAYSLAGGLTGTVEDIFDDLAAVYDSAGSLTNAAALATRAAERASDYYRRLTTSWEPLRRRYALPCAEAGCLPGRQLQAASWFDLGDGMRTEVEQAPGYRPQSYPALRNQTLDTYSPTFPSGGSTTLYGLVVNGPMYWPTYAVTAWTADQNNFALPAGNIRLRVSSDAHYRTVTGVAPGATPSGRLVCLHNVGSYVILLANESGSSAAANRITTCTGNDYWLAPDHEVTLVYDSTDSRWRVSESSEQRLPCTASYLSWGSDQHDWDITRDAHVHEIAASTTGIELTGIQGGKHGLRHVLWNEGSNDITLLHESSSSTAANRFWLPNGAPWVMKPRAVAEVEYNVALERWMVHGPRDVISTGQVAYGGSGGEITGDNNLVYDGTYITYDAATTETVAGFDNTKQLVSLTLGAGLDLTAGVLSATGGLTETYVGYGDANDELTGSADMLRLAEGYIQLRGVTAATFPALALQSSNGGTNQSDGDTIGYIYFTGRHGGSIQGGARIQGYVQSVASATAKVLEVGVGTTDTATEALWVRADGKISIRQAATAGYLLSVDSNGNVVSTIDGTAIVDTGDIGVTVQGYDADLAALAANSTNGLWARTGAGTGAARTITGTANQVTLTNGDGVSGNPTVSLAGPHNFTTLTDHGVLVGSGTSAIDALAVGTNGQLLIGNTGADPAFATMSGDATITAGGVLAIGANKVTDAMLRQSAGLSVLARAANSPGNVADLTAATDYYALRRNGTALVFEYLDQRSISQILCKITHSTTQTLAATAYTAIACDTETLDVYGLHSTSSNNSRITIPSGMDGWWLLIGTILSPTLSGVTELGWAYNGGYIPGGVTTVSAVSTFYQVTALYQGAATGYFQLLCYNSNAASRTLPQGTNYPFLQAIYLGN